LVRAVQRALEENDAEVWVLRTATIALEREEALDALLDPVERARAARFAFARDRRDYRVAHGLLRLLLSAVVPRDPRDWRIRAGAGGKPELVEGQADGLFFNISHTRGCVACLVGRRPLIGVDVESRERRTAADLGERLFAPAEVALLRHPDEQERWDRFFRIWTLKEAYLKGTGLGLRMPLDSFAFSLDPPRVRFAPSIDDDPTAWHFEQRLLPGGFIAAVSQREPAGPPPLRWRVLDEVPGI
jgi:4'-phosphopantetheinyl transferase